MEAAKGYISEQYSATCTNPTICSKRPWHTHPGALQLLGRPWFKDYICQHWVQPYPCLCCFVPEGNWIDQILIQSIHKSEEDKLTCMIVDQGMACTLKIAKNMGLRSATFWPASAGILAAMLSIPKLIENGIIDANAKTRNNTSSDHEIYCDKLWFSRLLGKKRKYLVEVGFANFIIFNSPFATPSLYLQANHQHRTSNIL